MAVETDYKLWLKMIDEEEYNEIFDLHQSVANAKSEGIFIYSEKQISDGKHYFIKCPYIDGLLLLTDKSRQSFLSFIEDTYAAGMDMHSWHSFKENLDKD